jgi:hypothetical protein
VAGSIDSRKYKGITNGCSSPALPEEVAFRVCE